MGHRSSQTSTGQTSRLNVLVLLPYVRQDVEEVIKHFISEVVSILRKIPVVVKRNVHVFEKVVYIEVQVSVTYVL